MEQWKIPLDLSKESFVVLNVQEITTRKTV
jgi:hypothetical protein